MLNPLRVRAPPRLRIPVPQARKEPVERYERGAGSRIIGQPSWAIRIDLEP